MLSGLFFMILIFIMVSIMVKVDLKEQEKALASDEACLFALTLKENCSAQSVFLAAGKTWHFSNRKIESDFKQYLHHSRMPRYVRQYLHEHLDSQAINAYQVRLFAGYRTF